MTAAVTPPPGAKPRLARRYAFPADSLGLRLSAAAPMAVAPIAWAAGAVAMLPTEISIPQEA